MRRSAHIIIGTIRLYRLLISPLLPFNQCRFFPTCSEYAIEAVSRHGALKGGALAIKRVLRCHPYSKHSGVDPVP